MLFALSAELLALTIWETQDKKETCFGMTRIAYGLYRGDHVLIFKKTRICFHLFIIIDYTFRMLRTSSNKNNKFCNAKNSIFKYNKIMHLK